MSQKPIVVGKQLKFYNLNKIKFERKAVDLPHPQHLRWLLRPPRQSKAGCDPLLFLEGQQHNVEVFDLPVRHRK